MPSDSSTGIKLFLKRLLCCFLEEDERTIKIYHIGPPTGFRRGPICDASIAGFSEELQALVFEKAVTDASRMYMSAPPSPCPSSPLPNMALLPSDNRSPSELAAFKPPRRYFSNDEAQRRASKLSRARERTKRLVGAKRAKGCEFGERMPIPGVGMDPGLIIGLGVGTGMEMSVASVTSMKGFEVQEVGGGTAGGAGNGVGLQRMRSGVNGTSDEEPVEGVPEERKEKSVKRLSS